MFGGYGSAQRFEGDAMQDIKANQRWLEGSVEVQIIRVFGIRILMQRNTSNDEEEIAEPDFRKRFTFVAER